MRWISDIVSPWTIASFIGIISILSTFFPRDAYEFYTRETNYMFGNTTLISIIIAFVSVFSISSYFGSYISKKIRYSPNSYDPLKYISKYDFVLVLSLITLLLTIYQIYTISQRLGLGTLVDLVGSGSGGSARQAVSEAISTGKVGWISVLFGYVLVLLTHIVLFNKSMFFRAIYIIMWLLFFVSSSISLSRDTIITTIIMCFIIPVFSFTNKGKIKIGKVLYRSFLLVSCLTLIFFGIDYVRNGGKYSSDIALMQFIGYFPASFNRFAAILSGNLTYPNSNWGYYTFQMLWDTPIINKLSLDLFSINQRLLPENSYENWINQFVSVRNAGLNPKYIWATTFGFAFSDFRYLSLLFFFFYGFISGILYDLFKRKNVYSLILYPVIAASVFKWWSTIYIMQRTTIICFILCFIVWLYIQTRKSLHSLEVGQV